MKVSIGMSQEQDTFIEGYDLFDGEGNSLGLVRTKQEAEREIKRNPKWIYKKRNKSGGE